MSHKIGFGVLAAVGVIALYRYLQENVLLPEYFLWLTVTSAVAAFYYFLDKQLSKSKHFTLRIPELVLNLLAVIGGFPGVWLGRVVFNHKTNIRRHTGMFVILVLSTLFHCAAIYLIFFRSTR